MKWKRNHCITLAPSAVHATIAYMCDALTDMMKKGKVGPVVQ